jgi:outer membrane protein TolC
MACSAFGESIALKEAVDRAAQMNPDIAIARLRTLEAEAEAESVRAEHLPQVTARVSSRTTRTISKASAWWFPAFPRG